MSKNKPPEAVTSYIKRFGETEESTRLHIRSWISTYEAFRSKSDLPGWLSFRLGCTSKQAQAAIQWAKEKR